MRDLAPPDRSAVPASRAVEGDAPVPAEGVQRGALSETGPLIIPGRTPFVVIADDWGRHVSTSQHLFRRLVGVQPLIWVNSFGHRRPRLTVYDAQRAFRKISAMISGASSPKTATGVQPDWLVHPRALPWHDVAMVHRFNTWSLKRDIRRALKVIAPGERPVFVTGTPAAYSVVGTLHEIASIYLCIDDYGEIVGTDKDLLAPLEERLLARVDAMIATAASLLETKRPASGRVLYLPQGVNYEHFSEARAVPPELAALPRPIIGFAGGVGPAIDFGIMRALARGLPQASIVLIGPHQQVINADDWPANVHFLGPRPYTELPAYVQAFDVGLIPYVLNAWTRAVDPLKLLEYLATGISVVSTGLPEVRKYESIVRIGEGEAAFVTAVREALTDRGESARQERQRVAKENRWEVRTARLMEFVEGVARSRAVSHHSTDTKT